MVGILFVERTDADGPARTNASAWLTGMLLDAEHVSKRKVRLAPFRCCFGVAFSRWTPHLAMLGAVSAFAWFVST
jgi:hypothetical protein